jgi:hypothetical protein
VIKVNLPKQVKGRKLTRYPADCFTRERGCGNSPVGLNK